MEIHKPKPWHGWREFLKEYLIIVVGVLTALGAEAVVEALHWRHLAEQHEHDLRESAQRIAVNALQRMAIGPCIQGELRSTAERLRSPSAKWAGLNANATGPVATYMPVNLTSSAVQWQAAAWDSALNDGALTHLPRDRVRVYANLFRTSQDILIPQQNLTLLLSQLTPLAFDRRLSDDAKGHFLEVIAEADREQLLMSSMSRSILALAASNDLWPADAMLKPRIDESRSVRGACVRSLRKADFLPGGEFGGPAASLGMKMREFR